MYLSMISCTNCLGLGLRPCAWEDFSCFMAGEIFEKAEAEIASGGIVIVPTDTLPGFSCDATDKGACLRVTKLKGKATGGPGESAVMSVVLRDVDALEQFSILLPAQREFISATSHLGTTFVVQLDGPSKRSLAHLASRNNAGTTIGARIVPHPLLSRLAASRPLVTTSVNLHGKCPAATIEEASTLFPERIALGCTLHLSARGDRSNGVDTGVDPRGPSTLRDVTGLKGHSLVPGEILEKVKVLRKGKFDLVKYAESSDRDTDQSLGR